MRRRLVGTAVGRIAFSLRDSFELARCALTSIESLGTLANDLLATKIVARLPLAGRTFIDVGAHLGSVFADVIHHDRTVRVIAFEPIPEKAAWLRQNFPAVEVHAAALADKPGQLHFFIDKAASGYSSLMGPRYGNASTTEIDVPVETLDAIDRTDVDVIKIDVEGAELMVVKGGQQLLMRNRPTVMFESTPPENDAAWRERKEIWELFRALSYEIFLPNRVAHTGTPLSGEQFVESHLYPRRTTNYFAIASERREEIRSRARSIQGIAG